MDPFWRPTSEEELDEFGGSGIGVSTNAVRTAIDKVRKRKGLQIEEKVTNSGGAVVVNIKVGVFIGIVVTAVVFLFLLSLLLLLLLFLLSLVLSSSVQ